MYYELLRGIVKKPDEYRIFLDKKDTRSGSKIRKLEEVLINKIGDYNHEFIKLIQTVCSREVNVLQVADVLIGAISYINRGISTSNAKLAIINTIRDNSGYSLLSTTDPNEYKFNLFKWVPKRAVL
jgi:hypothetical protein